MNIYDVPDELLLQMCESWDTPTLLNMSEAYSKVYQLCWKIRQKRQDKYNRINKWVNLINDNEYLSVFDLAARHRIILTKKGNSIHISESYHKSDVFSSILKLLFPNRISNESKIWNNNQTAQMNPDWEYIFINDVTNEEILILLNKLYENNLVRDVY